MASAALMLTLAACGAQTAVTGGWQESRPTVPFDHMLVVGISPNSRVRRSFEQALAQLISAGGTPATASIEIDDATRALTPDVVADMVRATGADAILVTRLASRKVAPKETPGHVGVKTEQVGSLSEGPGLVDLFSTTYNEYEEPGEFTAKSTVVLDTSVFRATDGGHLVYALVTKSSFRENRDDIVADVTSAIASQLRRDHVIR